MHFVYMARCADGTLYTGYARDPERRIRIHNAGRGAKYTASRLPVCLVYCEPCATRSAALKREHCHPGDALVDDRDKFRHLWERKGRVFIHHKDARTSIEALRAGGFI